MDMSATVLKHAKRLEIERLCEWEKLATEIPYISFPADWEIRIVPPLRGVVVRFQVRQKSKPYSPVSVVLHEAVSFGGMTEKPYWEVYPLTSNTDEEAFERIALNDVQDLLSAIQEAFNTP